MKFFASIPSFIVLSFLKVGVKAADLVLEGYAVQEVLVDSEPYEGDDGLVIHEGDHLHDPCLNYTENGERLTLAGNSEDSARGFIVVNDCQVIECTKWTTEDGKNGGETVIYNIVDAEEGESGMRWKVAEDGFCSCDSDVEEDSCYLGKFLLVEDYSDDKCDIEFGSPGSISCKATEDEPVYDEPVITGSVVDVTAERINISRGGLLGALAAAVVVALMTMYCCCCRKKKTDNETSTEKIGKASLAVPAGSAESQSNKRERSGGFFGGRKKGKADQENKQVERSSSSDTDESEESKGVATKGWFGSKKKNEDTKQQKQESSRAVANGNAEDAAQSKKGKGWFSSPKNQTEAEQTSKSTIKTATPEESTSKRGPFGSKKTKEEVSAIEETSSAEASKNKSGWFQKKNDENGAVPAGGMEQTASPKKQKASSSSEEKTAKKGKDDGDTPKAKKDAVENPDASEGVDCTCCGM